MTAFPGFPGPQACSLTGVTYRQLDYWARTALVRPTIADAKGSGSRRLYSHGDLLLLTLLKELTESGVALPWIRRTIDSIREAVEHLAERPILIVTHRRAFSVAAADVASALAAGELSMVVDFGAVSNHLAERVDELVPVRSLA